MVSKVFHLKIKKLQKSSVLDMLTFKNKSSLPFYMNSLETIQLSNEKCIAEIYKQYKFLLTNILHWFTLIILEFLILFHFSHSCLVDKLCLTLCNPEYCSMPTFLFLHRLPELAQTHVHWVSDAIQPSYLLLSPSPPAFNLSQPQSLF